MQVTVKGFDNVYGIHLGKKTMTVFDLIEPVFQLQKNDPEDEKDGYGLTPENYAFIAEGSEEEDYLDIQTVLKGGEVLYLRAINF